MAAVPSAQELSVFDAAGKRAFRALECDGSSSLCPGDLSPSTIASAWKIERGKPTFAVTIPANTTAAVYVPANGVEQTTESGNPARSTPGVKFLRMVEGNAVFEVGSESYKFSALMGDE